jgi:EAL domain-containing protein (putative c-di-GMP-specific phosphodiesterase class I)
VTAAEALLRWKHPKRGMIGPATFIPVAERFGLIGSLGNWVIEDACRQSRAWRDKGLRMRVAINLSAFQMRQDDLVERITTALARHRIDPSLLTCEITESVAMEDTKATQTDVPPPRRDRRAPVDRRLRHRLLEPGLSAQAAGRGAEDRPQLRDGPRDQRRCARGRRRGDHLAHALGLKVVAEGVETSASARC